MVINISWTAAESILRELIPGCKSFDPDTIANSAREIGCITDFVQMTNWESRTDREILDEIIDFPLSDAEDVVIITEASYFREAGPFAMSGAEVMAFAERHLATYGECAFNGDFVLVRHQQYLITLFHHEGYYCSIDFRSGIMKA